jgi:hypothetical protein
MAWRIDKQVLRGKIDNRSRGRVTGKIWLAGRDEPVILELTGNPWRDLAGQVLRFFNPNHEHGEPEKLQGLAQKQAGVVGDITASRKVRALDCSIEEFRQLYAARKPTPWHWANSLYLEWFSQRNGRVVIESADYRMELDPETAWQMSEEEKKAQREASEILGEVQERIHEVRQVLGEADG